MAWLATSETNITNGSANSLVVLTSSLTNGIILGTANTVLKLRAWASILVILSELRN